MNYPLLFLLSAMPLCGQQSSANYEIHPATIDGGGGPSASVSYSVTASSIGGIYGQASSSSYESSSGYIPQIPLGTILDLFDYDSWKTQFFQAGDPRMTRADDPDQDGMSNEEEFYALTDPTDPDSRFNTQILADAGLWDISFSPKADDTLRTYTLFHRDTLDALSIPILNLQPTTIGQSGLFDNVSSFGSREFYHIQITLTP